MAEIPRLTPVMDEVLYCIPISSQSLHLDLTMETQPAQILVTSPRGATM
jgi:hypothetical protein